MRFLFLPPTSALSDAESELFAAQVDSATEGLFLWTLLRAAGKRRFETGEFGGDASGGSESGGDASGGGESGGGASESGSEAMETGAGETSTRADDADAADVAEGGADIEANVEDAEEDAAMDGTTNATSCFLTTLYLDCRTLR